MEFIDNFFSFILTRIMLGLLSPSSAEADVGCGGNYKKFEQSSRDARKPIAFPVQ